MTPDEAKDLAHFAHEAMKKSSDAQETILRAALLKFPYAVATDVIVKYATEHEFISPPQIGTLIRAAMGGTAADRMEREQREFEMRRRDEARQKQTADASVTAAVEFCRAHPDDLDEWRRQVEVVKPGLRWACKGKSTLDSPALMCAIFAEFSGGEVMA